MKKLTLDQILGIVRHVMTIAGTLLIATGNIAEGSWEVLTGSALSLVAIAWSVMSKPDAQD